MPELRHLRCFVVAAEELNFTRAAARLHIAQQSLSSTIGLLEQELGVRLFDRTTRLVKLTAAGDTFLPAARRVLAAADDAFAAVRAKSEAWPEVQIGFSFTLDDHIRYALLERFMSEHPKTRVRIRAALSGELIELLLTGDLDCVVAFCPPTRRGIELVDLMEVPMWVLLSPDHRLAAAETLELATLRDETFILAAEPGGEGFNSWLLQACTAAGFTPATILSPPLAMNFRPSTIVADAVTLANWHPQLLADGNVLRALAPPVLAPYAVAIRSDTTGVGRVAFQSLVSRGPEVAATIRRRDAGL